MNAYRESIAIPVLHISISLCQLAMPVFTLVFTRCLPWFLHCSAIGKDSDQMRELNVGPGLTKNRRCKEVATGCRYLVPLY